MDINIYTTPTCPYCDQAKAYFKGKNVKFKEIDVTRDSEKAQEMIRKSGQMSVPVIEINGEIVIGFNKAKINALIGK